ncbi:MAG TPA: thioredoxin domain-containing protein [Rhodothermales bacterium]
MMRANRLAGEQSPYLLQHQHNPVDWYPWSDEAFERAAREDRPIFLSIGYATCHWCHVMERESFEDESVARLLNDHFVSIKVDREERPDIDSIYMTVCQLLAGQGGWPLTIVMTPDRRPFFAATYIPKHTRHGRLGLMELLPRIAGVWRDQRDEVLASAEHMTQTLRRASAFSASAETLDVPVLDAAYQLLLRRFDGVHGGFGAAPKFPTPHNLLFLLRYWHRTGERRALAMAAHTLERMREGGIFDQLGGGFHRYSTDAEWLLPHFEKMLYDQALLAVACAEAFQATSDPIFAETARSVLAYVDRDLGSRDGGFHSAEDADSEGEEGKFYLWTLAEVESVLEPDDAALVARRFGMHEDGNFEDEATRERTGQNVLHVAVDLEALARESGKSVEQVAERLEHARRLLFEHREKRVRPALDDKVLTDWSGLAIAAFAICGRAMNEPAYVGRARRAAEFLLRNMLAPDGTLLHRYRSGAAGITGMADDYAGLIWGLIELYQSTFDAHYLKHAVALSDVMHAHFWDGENGGYFLSRADAADLIVRQKEMYDGASPSANSLQAWNLIRLSRLTGRVEFEERASSLFAFAAPFVREQPSAHTALLMALEASISPSTEVVIAGDPEATETKAFVSAVRSGYRPHLVALLHAGRPEHDGPLEELAPYVAAQGPVNGQPAAYLCREFACQAPTTDPDALRRMLDDSSES